MSTATQARALIARLLNGDLLTQTHTAQRHDLRLSARVLPLRESPVTAVTTVTVGGVEVDAADYSFTPFSLVREDGNVWPTTPILVTYTTGWAEGSEPQEVQDAIALATEWFDTHPGAGITSVSIGSESASRSEAPPIAILELLAPWVRRC